MKDIGASRRCRFHAICRSGFSFSLGPYFVHAQTFLNSQATGKRDDPNALYAKGMAKLQAGDLAGARTIFEDVVRLAPSSAEAHNSLGFVLLTQGDAAAAIPQLQEAVRLKPEFVQAMMPMLG